MLAERSRREIWRPEKSMLNSGARFAITVDGGALRGYHEHRHQSGKGRFAGYIAALSSLDLGQN